MTDNMAAELQRVTAERNRLRQEVRDEQTKTDWLRTQLARQTQAVLDERRVSDALRNEVQKQIDLTNRDYREYADERDQLRARVSELERAWNEIRAALCRDEIASACQDIRVAVDVLSGAGYAHGDLDDRVCDLLADLKTATEALEWARRHLMRFIDGVPAYVAARSAIENALAKLKRSGQ
jgi:chromosome segregation ATPase